MEFELLADSIKQINDKASSAAKSAVNQLMTLRNWAIGYYIVEYEQDGSDRAEYGSHLLKNLEKQIDQKGMNYTLFKACRQFYKVYPQIGSTVSSEFKLPDFGKSSTVSNEFVTDPDVLVNNLSFSHIREIMVLNDAFERFLMSVLTSGRFRNWKSWWPPSEAVKSLPVWCCRHRVSSRRSIRITQIPSSVTWIHPSSWAVKSRLPSKSWLPCWARKPSTPTIPERAVDGKPPIHSTIKNWGKS